MSEGIFRPSGATPWSSYNTPRIWAMVEGEDDPEAWRQVAALGSLGGLLKDQRARLEAAREKLIDAWPPQRNKAAAAFVDQLDELLVTMRADQDIADANAGALGRILEALRQAKVKIAPLYQSYLDKSDDWIPGWWDRAEDELDEQARQHMREAELLVAHPENAITAPSGYEFRPHDALDGSTGRPRAGLGDSIAVPHEPPPSLPSGDAVSPPLTPGPSLAGVITPPPGPTPNVVAASTGTVGAPALPGLVISSGALLPGVPPGPGAAGGRGGLSSGRVIGPPAGGPAVAAKPTPPSWLPPGSAQPRGGRPAVPVVPGRRPHADDQDEGISFDPDDWWAVAAGVAPVIEASRTRCRHDPGPGVIGWLG
jgi:hypothetical protein